MGSNKEPTSPCSPRGAETPGVEWEKDEDAKECRGCKSSFGVLRRKHHCRGCGRIFCDTCAAAQVVVPWLNKLDPVRTCLRCVARIEREQRGCQCRRPGQEERCGAPVVGETTWCAAHLCPHCKGVKSSREETCAQDLCLRIKAGTACGAPLSDGKNVCAEPPTENGGRCKNHTCPFCGFGKSSRKDHCSNFDCERRYFCPWYYGSPFTVKRGTEQGA
eukprot:TRINITY_DN8761_c0_g1_i1.p1 TRINITY_DN8761_c0_g1~~TRINITY_DN8761_c0_g1_i1.p1  ORF type:complete len:218 (+),score=17.77 TRINITY_DN8761_c0_g1_i1:61-714(+)